VKLPKDRVPYSAIVDRPPLSLPGGARVAVWTIVNVEEWAIERNMPRTVLPPPYGQPLMPDLPGAGQRGRNRDRVRVAAPDHEGQILEDQGEAHGREHLAELLPGQALEERIPLRDADQRDGERAHDEGEPELLGPPDDRQRHVAAEQVVRPVGHVDDAHHAEDEREAAGEEEQQRAVGDAVEDLDDPEIRGQHAGHRMLARDSSTRLAGISGRAPRPAAAVYDRASHTADRARDRAPMAQEIARGDRP